MTRLARRIGIGLLLWNFIFGVWNLYLATIAGSVIYMAIGLLGLITAGATSAFLRKNW